LLKYYPSFTLLLLYFINDIVSNINDNIDGLFNINILNFFF